MANTPPVAEITIPGIVSHRVQIATWAAAEPLPLERLSPHLESSQAIAQLHSTASIALSASFFGGGGREGQVCVAVRPRARCRPPS